MISEDEKNQILHFSCSNLNFDFLTSVIFKSTKRFVNNQNSFFDRNINRRGSHSGGRRKLNHEININYSAMLTIKNFRFKLLFAQTDFQKSQKIFFKLFAISMIKAEC